MKIAVYMSDYRPETGGGHTFERDVFEALLRRHPQYRHSFAVLSRSFSRAALDQRLAGLPISNHTVSASRIEWLFQGATRGMAQRHRLGSRPSALDRAMKEAGADLLWFVGQPASPQWTDYPYITTIWDVQHRITSWFPELTSNGEWENREWVNTSVLRRATAVITGTKAGQAEIERHYQVPPERIITLPHPTPQFALDAARSPPEDGPASLGLKEPYLLYPAQFWSHKNHVNLLLALAELRDRHGYAPQLAFVGSDKGNKKHVADVAGQLGLAGQVHFLGFVPQRDLVALYRRAVMLVYPSWFGPENLPPLEAFALGCPVAASRIPGAREQLGDAAVLFDPSSPSDIADKIAAVQADAQLRARLVAAGHARAKAWTADDYVGGLMAFADKLEPVLRCWAR